MLLVCTRVSIPSCVPCRVSENVVESHGYLFMPPDCGEKAGFRDGTDQQFRGMEEVNKR